MATPDNLVVIYKELADAHERQGQPQMRDRYLVLAADAALSAGSPAEADLLLGRLLRSNPHHMLRPFATFSQAMASPDIQNYVGELRRTHPPAQAETEFDALRTARGTQGATQQMPTSSPPAPAGNRENGSAAESDREPLKVYRVRDVAEPPTAPTVPRAPSPAAPRPAAAPPKAPPRPARSWSLPAGLPTSVPPRPPSAADAEDTAPGSWLSVCLFVLLFAAGLALAGWALLRPFWPLF
jgi:hypothetical protein